jgi:hypothetical protein
MLVLAMEFSRGMAARCRPSTGESDVHSERSAALLQQQGRRLRRRRPRARRPVAPSKRNRGARPSSQRPTGDRWSTTGRCSDSRIASDRPRSTWTR